MRECHNENNKYNISQGLLQKHQKDENAQKGYYSRKYNLKDNIQKNQIENILNITDNNAKTIFNSSMKQLQKILGGIQQHDKSTDLSYNELLRQNSQLRANIFKMKKIIKQKLEVGLSMQREELSRILQEYIALITKLLQDKEDLTNRLNDKENAFSNRQREIVEKYQALKETNQRLKKGCEERDQQIRSAKQQTEEFLSIIQQYEDDTMKDHKKQDELNARIQQLEEQLQEYKSLSTKFSVGDFGPSRTDLQESKINTLIELLEESQQENIRLREQLQNLLKSKQQLARQYCQKLHEQQQESEQQFMEYDKIMRQALQKKDQALKKLTQQNQNYSNLVDYS